MASAVERYVYEDANGQGVFRVLRFEPKDFRQQHRNGSGWKSGRNATPDLPYHLPEVIAAVERGEPIFITEGEKDADAARAQGVTATTNPGGAGKWSDELSEHLRGASVVIIYDRDSVGYRHARSVAASLKRHGASRVRFARAKAGNDLSDHLAAGLRLNQLVKLAPPDAPDHAEPREPEPESDDRPRSAIYQLVHLKLRDYAAAQRLPAPQPRADGAGFEACCPAHDDRKPSLGVRLGDERAVVLHCQRGCAPEEIVEALGIDWTEFVTAAADPEDPRERKVAVEVERLEVREEARRRVASKSAAVTFELPPAGRTLADDLAEPRDKQAFAIDRLHPAGGNSLLVAQYKTGKTTLALNLVKALADDLPFLGEFKITPLTGRIAVLNYEMSADQFRDWIEDMDIDHQERIAQPFHLRGHRLPFWEPEFMERLAKWLHAEEIEWLIEDPAARAWAGFVDNENDNAKMAEFTDALDELKRQGGVANLLLTTHTGRARYEEGEEQSRGATRLEDWADSLWYLTRDKGSNPEDAPRALRAIGRDVDVEPVDLEFLPGRELRSTGRTRNERREEEAVERVLSALAGLGGGATTTAIKDALGGRNDGRQTRAIQRVVSEGYMVRRYADGSEVDESNPKPGVPLKCYLTDNGREFLAPRIKVERDAESR